MRLSDNIEKLFIQTKIETNTEVDKVVLGDAVNAMSKSKEKTPASDKPGVWRIIMRSKITRFATAAVIIVAVLVGINFFGGSIDGSSIALAETLETMKKMPWVHVISEFDTPEGKRTCEEWISFEPRISAGKGTRGVTNYTNYSEGKQYLYNPQDPYSNKIIIAPLPFVDNQFNFPNSPIDMITQVLERAKDQKSDISREISVLDNIDVEVIHITNDNDQLTVYRDIERNLIIKWDSVYTIRKPKPSGKVQRKQTSKETSETNSTIEIHKRKHYFDYPDDGPGDIYALGAPLDAEIDNYCPTGDVADIITEVRHRIEKAYDGYGAIILESRVNDGNSEQPKIILMRPENSDKFSYNWTRIKSLAWFHPSDFSSYANSGNTTYEMLPADTEHEGLIGFKVIQIKKSSVKRKRIDEYWLDPEKDYLVMDHIRFDVPMNRRWDSTTRTITLSTQQTPDGQWYPSHVSYEWEYTDSTGQHKQYIDKQIIFETEHLFPDDNYKTEYFFNAERRK